MKFGTFDSYRSDAAKVVVEAGSIARRVAAESVAPKHLLAAIAGAVDTAGGRMCERLSLRYAIGDYSTADASAGEGWNISWSSAAEEVIELAAASGADLGYVDTSVLLRCLLLVEDAEISEILSGCGLSVGEALDAIDATP